MTTTAFRNIRSLSQLASVVLILINIPLPFLLILRLTFVCIESDYINMGIRNIAPIFKITSMVNITLGLFASCGVNSKVKFYMRLYLMISILLFIVLAVLLFYVRTHYLHDLLTQMYRRVQSDQSVKNTIELNLSCSTGFDKTCEKIIQEEVGMIKHYYMLIAVPSMCLNSLNFVLLKVATGISIEAPPVKLPNFIEKTRVGMNTESLRNKRIVCVASNSSLDSAMA